MVIRENPETSIMYRAQGLGLGIQALGAQDVTVMCITIAIYLHTEYER